MSVFSDEPKEIKSNGTRKSKTMLNSFGLAYIVSMIRKGETKGMNKPGVSLDKFVEVTGIKPTEKQRKTLSNFTHKINRVLPSKYGIRVFYGKVENEAAIYFRWVKKSDGKENKYEISKTEIKKYYAWLDEYVLKYDEVQEAQETLDNEREKKRPSKKVIEETQAVVFGIELPNPPAVKVDVVKA